MGQMAILIVMLFHIYGAVAVWIRTGLLPSDVLEYAINPATDSLASCLSDSMHSTLCGKYWGAAYYPYNTSCSVLCEDPKYSSQNRSAKKYQIIYRRDEVPDKCSDIQQPIPTSHTQNLIEIASKPATTTLRTYQEYDECIVKWQPDGCLLKVEVKEMMQRYEMQGNYTRMPDAAGPAACASPDYIKMGGALAPFWMDQGPALFVVWNQENLECLGFYARLLDLGLEISKPESFDTVKEILNHEHSLVYFYHPRNDSCKYRRPINFIGCENTIVQSRWNSDLFHIFEKSLLGLSFLSPYPFPLSECESACACPYQLASIRSKDELVQLRKILPSRVVGIGLYYDIIYNETRWADGAQANYNNFTTAFEPTPYNGRKIQSRVTITKIGAGLQWSSQLIDSEVYGCLCRKMGT